MTIIVIMINMASSWSFWTQIGYQMQRICSRIVSGPLSTLALAIDIEIAKTITSFLRCFGPLLAWDT